MVTVQIPGVLRAFTGGAAHVQVRAMTVRDALVELERSHPGVTARLFDASGAVKPFIRIYVGPDDITGLAGLDTSVHDRDEISIIPAVAGGRDA